MASKAATTHLRKQPNSRYCFLCGLENPIGLKLAFYEDDDGRVLTHFTPAEEHQGYPGVLHGGITSALFDETIGRVLVGRDFWAMTVELSVRFRKPIPLGEQLTVVGELVNKRGRLVEGKGEIRLADDTVAATAKAKYIILADEQVESFRQQLGSWQVVPDETLAEQ